MSTPSIELPEPLMSVLREKDAATDDFDEADVSFVLERKLEECGEISDDQRKACFAEVAALQMPLKDNQEKSRWGTRYGPVVEGTRQDGSLHSFPDISHIDAKVIAYWKERAVAVKHPVFKARYADVLWDMTKATTGGKPSIDMARQAIDAYIECGSRFHSTDTAENRLERALELALSIGDKGNATSALAAMIKLLDSTDHPGSRLLWLFDLPHRMNGVKLLEEHQAKIVTGLEAELQRICGSDAPVGLVAKEPALRLAGYYEAQGHPDDAKRVIRIYGDALAMFAEKAQGLVAMHWYQEAYGIFLKYGLKEEAEKFQIAAKRKGDEAQRQMVSFSHSVEIPAEKMDEFVDGIIADSLAETIERIAVNFIPSLDELRKQLAAVKQETKLLSMISVAKLGENQVIARAGAIDSDPEGRLMFQMTDNLKWTAIFLGKALDRARERYGFTSHTVLPILIQSPLFDAARTFFFEQGIDAYHANDHVKAIHVLVPQIESCLRRLLAMLGKPTNKHRRSDLGVMIEKSLNDILESEPVIQQCLGDDTTLYLRVLLCDPRGLNIRNDLSHGLMLPTHFNRFLSDRLIHVLFLLAMIRVTPSPPTAE